MGIGAGQVGPGTSAGGVLGADRLQAIGTRLRPTGLPFAPYLKAYGAAAATGVGGTITVPFSMAFNGNLSTYTTATGDCVVVSYVFAGNNAFVTAGSGCGATWTVNDHFGIASAFDQGILVGYNCTAGGSSVVITGNAIGGTSICIVAVFGSLTTSNPQTAAVDSGGSTASTTTGSLSYTSGSQILVVASGGPGTSPWSSTSWSNGITNIHISDYVYTNMVSLDGVIATSGSSTTVTAARTAASGIGAYAVALTHL